MCDVCKCEGLDSAFRNGPRRPETFRQRLYNFYHEKEAIVALCHIHSYELFLIGEKRFVERHPLLVKDMVNDKKKYSQNTASSF